jgi:methylmalonyl-CoA mutase
MAPSRMARNATALSVAKVADPAAGSGGLEALTRQLCGAAWSQFQETGGAGGAYAALANGLIQRKVAAVRAEREAAVARGREALIGTTKFSRHTRTSGRCTRTCANEATRGGTSGHRAAPEHPFGRAFEGLRDASDRVQIATGARLKVFLANLGTPSDFTARTTFAKNFSGVAASRQSQTTALRTSMTSLKRSKCQARGLFVCAHQMTSTHAKRP